MFDSYARPSRRPLCQESTIVQQVGAGLSGILSKPRKQNGSCLPNGVGWKPLPRTLPLEARRWRPRRLAAKKLHVDLVRDGWPGNRRCFGCPPRLVWGAQRYVECKDPHVLKPCLSQELDGCISSPERFLSEVCRQLTLLEAWSAGCAPRFPRPHGEMGVGTVIAVD